MADSPIGTGQGANGGGGQSGSSGAGGTPASGGGNNFLGYFVATTLVSVITAFIYHSSSSSSPSAEPTTAEVTTPVETPTTPAVSGHIVAIDNVGQDTRNSAYFDMKVSIDLTGLLGRTCTIKWASYYTDATGTGGTATGYQGEEKSTLVAYDPERYTQTLAIHYPDHSGDWGVHVFVYGPDGELLDNEDGPTG